jgi:hypothetical protein
VDRTRRHVSPEWGRDGVGYRLKVIRDQALCLSQVEHAVEALERLRDIASLLIGEAFLVAPPVIVMTVLAGHRGSNDKTEEEEDWKKDDWEMHDWRLK